MFRINKDVEYALLALRAMDAEARVFPAREMAESLGIPAGILSKILQRLSHAGLVASVQGPRGGYRLQRSGDEITVGDVVDAVRGSQRIVACIEEPGSCGKADTCTIRHGFETVQTMWLDVLNSLTLRRFNGIPAERRRVGAGT